MKKVISLLLALVMALSLLPTAVWAEGEDAAAPAEEVSESFLTVPIRSRGTTGATSGASDGTARIKAGVNGTCTPHRRARPRTARTAGRTAARRPRPSST